ncbi:hypothetical protein WAE61_18220 [Comamonadaceae bacterium PP-2]
MSHAHQPPATAAGAAPLLSYQPVQPRVNDDHTSQRWFTGHDTARGAVVGQTSRYAEIATRTLTEVVRNEYDDQAKLSIALGSAIGCRFTTLLDPENLRKLAFILLDAAHDIEQNPAAKLAQQAQEAA